MTDELKPVRCGCGGEAKVQRVKTLKSHVLVVMCTKCEIATNYYTKEAEAITAWNTAMGERTAKVKDLDRRSETSIGWEGTCTECGSYTMHDMNYCFHCGARLEWE